MTAVAGYWDLDASIAAVTACQQMLSALRDFGRDDSSIKSQGSVAFGRALRRVVPEDDFDSQPYLGCGGRCLFIAEGRIDNRSEVAETLGIESAQLAISSDAQLLLRAWERWGLRTFDSVLGDVALAVWDSADHSLTLARSPLSSRSLFYYQTPRFIAFASMPVGLLALSQVPREPDLDHFAALLARRPQIGAQRTAFRNILAVPPGRAIRFNKGESRVLSLWEPRIVPVPRQLGDYAEALRAELERAVGVQLRRRSGFVASQLSGGRDSTAVATTAAVALAGSGEELIALTGAPRQGFQQTVPATIPVDESDLAATTAAAHDNVKHLICRSRRVSVRQMFEPLHRAHFGPMLTPSNAPWSTDVGRAAQEQGASILLTGGCGNFSISSGGRNALMDLWRESSLQNFIRAALRVGGESFAGWRNVATITIGAFLPRSVYAFLRARAGHSDTRVFQVPTLRQPWRGIAEEIHAQAFDPRPARDFRALLRDELVEIGDPGRLTATCWDLDSRDPTTDRRLVELCFSMPAEGMYSGSSDRPAFDAAFADRIPRRVLDNRIRAYQQADWFEVFDPGDIRNAFDHYRRNAIVSELVDPEPINAMLEQWPADAKWMADSKRFAAVSDDYRNKLLLTLSIASFIDVNFPDARA